MRRSRTLLLDTHFLVWILRDSKRLSGYGWLERYRPWTISPVSLLEVALLIETGRIGGRVTPLIDALSTDTRFLLDEIPLIQLVRHAVPLGWTRDPFDRLLAAHSAARRLPLCTLDGTICEHHELIAAELA